MKRTAVALLTTMLVLGGYSGIQAQANGINSTQLIKAKSSVSFEDVMESMYSYEAITWLANKGIIKGYGNGVFGAKDDVTREQVAALIYRYMQLDDARESDNPYNDLDSSAFTKEVLAVSKKGYMKGYGDGKFRPEGILTRAEMAQVMMNVFELEQKESYDFHDMDASHWANDAVRALYGNGLTFGEGNYSYNPDGTVTREQYATFLYRGIHLDPDFEAEPIPPKEEPTAPEPKPEPEPEPTPTPPTNPDPDYEIPGIDPVTDEILDEKGIDKEIVEPGALYFKSSMDKFGAELFYSDEAQTIIKEINKEFGVNFKYGEIAAGAYLVDRNLPIPHYARGQIYFSARDNDDFDILFIYNEPSTVEFAKRWMKLINPTINAESQIDDIVRNRRNENFKIGGYSVRIGKTNIKGMLEIEVEPYK